MLLVGLCAGATAGGIIGWERGKIAGKEGSAGVIEAAVNGAAFPPQRHATSRGATSQETDEATDSAPSSQALADRILLMGKGKWDEDLALSLMATMTETELTAFLARISSIKETKSRLAMKEAAYRAWARIHPEAALASAGGEPPGSDRMLAIGAVFGEWATQNSKQALARAEGQDDVSQRNLALRSVINGWARTNQEEALNYLDNHRELPGVSQLIAAALQPNFDDLAQVDYEKQADLARRYTANGRLDDAASGIVGMWAMEDPAAALAWVGKVESAAERAGLVRSIYESWSGTDILAALQSAASLNDTDARDDSIKAIVSNWMQRDPLSALDYVLKSGSTPLLQQMANQSHSLVNVLTGREMGAFLNQIPEGSIRQSMLTNLVSTLAGNGDYVRAVEMVKLTADPQQRGTALFEVARSWSQNEPAEVEAWIRDFPASPERDAAMAGYIPTVAALSIPDALSWADTLQDEGARLTAQLNIAYQWMRKSPAEAETWMTRSAFKDADREKVRNAAARGSTTIFISPTTSMP